MSEYRLLLLDTHIWIWLVQGNPTLATAARDRIRGAANDGNLKIAAISLWEVAMLASRSRIELRQQTLLWLDDAVMRSGLTVEPLTVRVVAESAQLPGSLHRDPADRMIVATSRLINATLMTRDWAILDYAAQGHVNAIAV